MVLAKVISRVQNRYRRNVSDLCGRRMVEIRPARPIISFTFDDFPRSALLAGGAILKRYGCSGTYYTSLGLLDRDISAGRAFSAADLRQAFADGHELGCHTFAHCHAWDTEPDIFEQSVLENRQALDKLLPGASFKSHSYPIAWPRPHTKRLVGRWFSSCRGGGQTFNRAATDLNLLKSYFLEKSRDAPAAVKKVIDDNRQACGWLIFSTHDVSEAPTTFGCSPSFLEAVVRWSVDSGARILPVAEALEAASAEC